MEFISIIENYFYIREFWVGFFASSLTIAPWAYYCGRTADIYYRGFHCPYKAQQDRKTSSSHAGEVFITYKRTRIKTCDCDHRRTTHFLLFKHSKCALNGKKCIAEKFIG